MPIRKLDTNNWKAYETLAAENGNVFNSPSWIKLYDSNLIHYGIFDNDQKLIAAFYLYQTKMVGLSYYKNPPYTPTIGLCYKNKAVNKANALAFDKSILTELAEFIQSLPYGLITLALPHHVKDTQPFIWKKFKVIPNYTYHLDLQLSAEQLLQNM
ncbi:MAG TPA: hypothetical protein PK289_12600, partial [Bacteroidia bacterium]|nr:hypothetical protein [Bacteroidia bacterium]